jgi:hypothetical protein
MSPGFGPVDAPANLQAESTAVVGWCLNVVVLHIAPQDAHPVHRYRADVATTIPGTHWKAASFREK